MVRAKGAGNRAPNDDIDDALLDGCQTQTTLGRAGSDHRRRQNYGEGGSRNGGMCGNSEGNKGRIKRQRDKGTDGEIEKSMQAGI